MDFRFEWETEHRTRRFQLKLCRMRLAGPDNTTCTNFVIDFIKTTFT
jgi:hypothetical protein